MSGLIKKLSSTRPSMASNDRILLHSVLEKLFLKPRQPMRVAALITVLVLSVGCKMVGGRVVFAPIQEGEVVTPEHTEIETTLVPAKDQTVSRIMPDQLERTVEQSFAPWTGTIPLVIPTRAEYRSLGGVPFGSLGTVPQFDSNLYLTLFLGRSLPKVNVADPSNEFCAHASRKMPGIATSQVVIQEMAMLLWGEAPSSAEAALFLSAATAAAANGLTVAQAVCVAMVHDPRFYNY